MLGLSLGLKLLECLRAEGDFEVAHIGGKFALRLVQRGQEGLTLDKFLMAEAVGQQEDQKTQRLIVDHDRLGEVVLSAGPGIGDLGEVLIEEYLTQVGVLGQVDLRKDRGPKGTPLAAGDTKVFASCLAEGTLVGRGGLVGGRGGGLAALHVYSQEAWET